MFYSALWAPKNDGSCWFFGKFRQKIRWKEVLGRIRSHVKNGEVPSFEDRPGNGQKTWQHSKDLYLLYLYPMTSYSITVCRAFTETLRHSKSPGEFRLNHGVDCTWLDTQYCWLWSHDSPIISPQKKVINIHVCVICSVTILLVIK